MRYALALFLFLSAKAYSFPDMSRHGYANCTTCHVSPAGGGLLTLYGRELSKELLSTTSGKTEQYFAYNAFPAISTDEKILVGGIVRALQVLRDNDSMKEARTILMQADVEAGYNTKTWALVGTAGRQEVRSGLESRGRFWSRRHYILGRITPHHQLRVGKFLKSYGVGDANHNLLVRKDLRFGFDTESYNVEYSWLHEKGNVFLTYVTDLKTQEGLKRAEKGLALNTSWEAPGKNKWGLSFFHGRDSDSIRNVMGAWGIGQFTKKLFLTSEIDFQIKKARGGASLTHGHVMSHQLAYEVFKGIVPFVSLEQKYLDAKNKKSELHSWGIGGHFYPRPHLELSGAIQKEARIASGAKDTLYWVMGQFYL